MLKKVHHGLTGETCFSETKFFDDLLAAVTLAPTISQHQDKLW